MKFCTFGGILANGKAQISQKRESEGRKKLLSIFTFSLYGLRFLKELSLQDAPRNALNTQVFRLGNNVGQEQALTRPNLFI